MNLNLYSAIKVWSKKLTRIKRKLIFGGTHLFVC